MQMPEPVIQTFHSQSEADTADVARRLADNLLGGEYISLEGDLGAGKTLFSRELAQKLGVEHFVTSPTFVLQKLYPMMENARGIKQLAHYDFYRICNYYELVDMGFEDHDSSTVVLAEWGDMFISDFPVKPIRISIIIEPEDRRTITMQGLHKEI